MPVAVANPAEHEQKGPVELEGYSCNTSELNICFHLLHSDLKRPQVLVCAHIGEVPIRATYLLVSKDAENSRFGGALHFLTCNNTTD